MTDLTFKVHRHDDGLVKSAQIHFLGPEAPGTLVAWRPESIDIHTRLGVVVAWTDEALYVMWHQWRQGRREELGSLMEGIRAIARDSPVRFITAFSKSPKCALNGKA